MPRKAIPQDEAVIVEIAKIRQYCNNTSLSILALSKLSGVSQSALERFMLGERKTVTKAAQITLNYIKNNNRHNRHNQQGDDRISVEKKSIGHGYQLIEDAVHSVWDGKPQTAELVASLIRALKPVLGLATASTRGSVRRKTV